MSSKIKRIERSLDSNNEGEKLKMYDLLQKHLGQEINIKIKEGYEEIQIADGISLDFISANQVEVLDVDPNWVHIGLFQKQRYAEKIIRIESIHSIEID